MRLFGEKLGMAFQIKDDLFDYGTAEIGKPLGIDIKEKKMTLPLIYALRNASLIDKKKVIFKIKNQSHKSKKVQEVIDFVKKSGGIEYAEGVMEKFYNEALGILQSFTDSTYKNSLNDLVQFTIMREK